MSVAVLLARAGKKVLVLEQHDQAGGCCHTFLDKGFEFDTGKTLLLGHVLTGWMALNGKDEINYFPKATSCFQDGILTGT